MSEKKWEIIFWVLLPAWGATQLWLLVSSSQSSDHRALRVTAFVLLFVLPIFWMVCSGIILNGVYKYQLGWRKERFGLNNEFVRDVDTTPAKRVTLQWLAPFAAIYFWLSGKERYKVGWIS